jgi:hypothetical protein
MYYDVYILQQLPEPIFDQTKAISTMTLRVMMSLFKINLINYINMFLFSMRELYSDCFRILI